MRITPINKIGSTQINLQQKQCHTYFTGERWISTCATKPQKDNEEHTRSSKTFSDMLKVLL